ncbi:tetratricopeptide repeat protein [Streptomyces sp. NPDC056738]|uniref:tetratricopeptide repeat protein n=1 Tax=Streptomyces sp. NPDC056738 TaxID=3345933 RepID=UPI0036787EFF
MDAPWDAASVVARTRATVEAGRTDETARVLGDALLGDPQNHPARRELALLLVASGRRDEALTLLRDELRQGDRELAWAPDVLKAALEHGDFPLAEACASLFAHLRWGAGSDPAARSTIPLSVPKLRHDIDQMHHLRRLGLLGPEYGPVIDSYQAVRDRLAAQGPDAREPLDSDANRCITDTYNRLLHVRDSPRVERALSRRWDPACVEERYLANAPGVVYVDDFLTEEALDELYRFCLESTVWFGNRYAHGRLGALMQDGFMSPLLMQIAEELRAALPRLIGDRYPLRQMWGFKCGPEVPADVTTHADFAAVNVNFWVTPDEANADDSSGGLVVHDVDAPMSWGFDTYNGRQDVIGPFLRGRRARSMIIPYRRNRAVIFNSDLFHASDAVRFRPGYENLRINVTMLYGDREAEVDHPRLSGTGTSGLRPAWRSAAFTRTGARRARSRVSRGG